MEVAKVAPSCRPEKEKEAEHYAGVLIRWRGACLLGFHLSNEKINREFFSCIQISILKQLHTACPFPLMPALFSRISPVLARRSAADHRLRTPLPPFFTTQVGTLP